MKRGEWAEGLCLQACKYLWCVWEIGEKKDLVNNGDLVKLLIESEDSELNMNAQYSFEQGLSAKC